MEFNSNIASSGQWLLTPQKAAELLAVSERTLWELTNRGTLPCVRVGRSVRYNPADLERWVEANKSKPE